MLRGDHEDAWKPSGQTGALWFWQKLTLAFRGGENKLNETIGTSALAELVEAMPPLERFPSSRNTDPSHSQNKTPVFQPLDTVEEQEVGHSNRERASEKMRWIADQADVGSSKIKAKGHSARVRRIRHPDFMRRLAIFGQYSQHRSGHDDSRDNDYLFAIEMYTVQVWHDRETVLRTKMRAD